MGELEYKLGGYSRFWEGRKSATLHLGLFPYTLNFNNKLNAGEDVISGEKEFVQRNIMIRSLLL